MKTRLIFLAIAGILALSPLAFPEIKAAAEKSTGTFIVLKVNYVDSLKDAADQNVIMERAIDLLKEKVVTLKLKSPEWRKKANDIIILSYQGADDPREVAQALAPKDLVVSFTVIGIFKGSEVSEVSAR